MWRTNRPVRGRARFATDRPCSDTRTSRPRGSRPRRARITLALFHGWWARCRDLVAVKKPFVVRERDSEVRNGRGQDSSSARDLSAAMALTMESRITLNDGSKIPVLGLGVWQAAAGKETR